MADFVLGIDIGGTNLKFGLVTPNGEISHKNSFPTKDFSQPILFVEKLYDFLEKEDLLSKISGIGIGAQWQFFPRNDRQCAEFDLEGNRSAGAII